MINIAQKEEQNLILPFHKFIFISGFLSYKPLPKTIAIA